MEQKTPVFTTFREQLTFALKQLGVLCSATDLVIDGSINLIDLGNLPNGNALMLRGYSATEPVRLLEVSPNNSVISSKEYTLEGLIYVLGSRGVQYDPKKAYAASQHSDSVRHRVEVVFNRSLSHWRTHSVIAEKLKTALIALAENLTAAELERQLVLLEARG
jgi:hypothetical protein